MRNNWPDAVRLFGKTQQMCDEAATPLMPECGGEYKRYVARAQQALDKATYDLAWDQGYALSLDETLELALHVADS